MEGSPLHVFGFPDLRDLFSFGLLLSSLGVFTRPRTTPKMRPFVIALLLLPFSASGFSQSGRSWVMSASGGSSSSTRSTTIVGSNGGISGSSARREFLSVGVAGALLGTPFVANAGYLNADKLPEVMTPDAAAVDRDVLKLGKVQDALKSTKYYLTVVQEMEKQLKANPQLDLGPAIRKYFAFNDIRTALNTVNEALDEDTQRGTDRLIRNTIQDITELEAANKLKAGVVRSDRKIAIMTGKLEKLDRAFTEFLAFFK